MELRLNHCQRLVVPGVPLHIVLSAAMCDRLFMDEQRESLHGVYVGVLATG